MNTILLVGHRGTGKSTLGRLLSGPDCEFVDLDFVIEQAESATCGDIIAESEERFRELERKHLARILEEPASAPRRIVALGAGMEDIPPEPLCVWLWRDGWEKAARDDRHRLRPDMLMGDELAWMRDTREPRWAEAAHLRYDIPRGRTEERNVAELRRLIDWATSVDSPLAGRCWLVPTTLRQRRRAVVDARRFRFAGVEIRSDLFDDPTVGDVDVLASLRTPDTGWLNRCDEAAAIDVDIEVLDAFVVSRLPGLRPRRLLLSTHPSGVDPVDVEALVGALRRVQSEAPEWAAEAALKYAPMIDSFDQLGAALALLRPLQNAGIPLTFLPQGRRFAWSRPLFATRFNATNYIPATLSSRRTRAQTTHDAGGPPFDFQDWLPHLVGPEPSHFEALIGDPAWKSRGDVFHRAASLTTSGDDAYLKVQVDGAEIEPALQLLTGLGIDALSVTSPLKKLFPYVPEPRVDYGEPLEPGRGKRLLQQGEPVRFANTLRWDYGTWTAIDTDELGMRAALEEIEEAGVEPGSIALIGRGDVSLAVVRAIEKSDWHLVHHASAREGWTEDADTGFDRVRLIVNASGDRGDVVTNVPDCTAWLDLHYADTLEPPSGELHFIGDAFFEAQAKAQRLFWRQGVPGPA